MLNGAINGPLHKSVVINCLPKLYIPSTLNVDLNSWYALGIWICGCTPFYKREFWASKSASAHSTKSLKISGCKR